MARYDGTSGNDTHQAGADIDLLYGNAGNDLLKAGDGADTVDGGEGDDELHGEAGDDVMRGGNGADKLFGGDGNDTLDLGGGSNIASGGAGADVIRVNADRAALQRIDGGDGDDKVDIAYTTVTKLVGGAGVDSLGIGNYIYLAQFDASNGFERLHAGGGVHGDARENVLDFSGLTVMAGSAGMTLHGEDGDDRLVGTTASDTLNGGIGNDRLTGGAGRDFLRGGDGVDRIAGDDGDDDITGGAGDDVIAGGLGKDAIDSDAGNDEVDGGADDDSIRDNGGSNVIIGGTGNDRIDVSGSLARGDTNNINAGDGDDLVSLSGGTVSRLLGGAGVDTLAVHVLTMNRFGAANGFEKFSGNFSIEGTAGADSLDFSMLAAAAPRFNNGGISVNGLAGADLIKGTANRDSLNGGTENDVLWGEGENDTIDGGAGDDVLHGGDGDDWMSDGQGANTMSGGAGKDTLRGGTLADTLDGGDGDDVIEGGTGANVIRGGAGNDYVQDFGKGSSIDGGDGDDVIRTGGHEATKVSVHGGAGVDTLDIVAGAFWNRIVASEMGFEKIIFSGGLTGTDGNDYLNFSGFERVSGYATVQGAAGDDVVIGSNADDTLTGHAGNDLLEGGEGDDRLDGSWIWRPDYTIDQQKDVVSYRSAKAAVTVDLKLTHTQDTIGAGKDYISNMEGIYGSLHGDTLRGDDHGNILIGDDGNDLLEGRGGFDEIFAGNGDDVVDGGAFSDRLFGDGGNDVIRGGIGIDWIDGGDGDDVLQGGGWAETFVTNYPGVDTLIGGAGADTYLFAGIGDLGAVNNGMGGQHAGIRNVVEFRAAEGDKIDLSAFGLAFNGESTSTAPGIVYEVKQTGTVVHVRTTGNLFSGSIQLDRAVELYEAAPGVLKGVEVIMGTEGDDHIVAKVDHDVIRGLGGHDLLIGGDGDDRIDGGAGDDVLQGGAGEDKLNGGEGKDTVSYADSAIGVTISLLPGEGGDQLTGIENARGSAFGDVMIGDDLANRLEGGDGDDLMYTGKGDDVLDGQGGADAYALGYSDMRGSIKTVVMDSADRIELAGFPELKWIGTGAFTGSYSHTEPKGPTGVPEIRYKHIDGDTLVQIDATGDGRSDAAFWVKGMTSFTYEDGTLRTAEVPPTEVTLTEAGDVWQGGAGPEKVYGLGGNDKLSGKEGKDTLFGDGGNDQLYGGADADQLLGGVGRDYLDGGQGADVMIGGTGADSYVVDDAGDQVIEAAEPGVPADQQVDVVTSFVDYQLTDAVENLSLFGGLQINGRGNALDNKIWGSGGNNQLFGLAGNDLLDGNGGTDVLVGGIGDDVYWVDDASDQVVEAAGEGTDTVLAFTSLTLADNVERLELVMDRSIDGTGNALNNVLTGNNLANVLTGGAGDDCLLGGLGADTLHGGLGKDALHGQGGADLMIGGAGNDDYFVDDLGDQVIEEAGGGASDYVSVSVNWTAVGEIEAINLSGVADLEVRGSATANTITGNGGANALHGEAGDDVLNGGGGNDVLFGGEGADRLFGSGGTDVMSGGAGNDVFGVTVGTDLWGDWITDFAKGDLIDFRAIDANVTTAANDDFTFIGGNAFSGMAGELRTELGKGANGGTMVYGDLNGDRIEDFGFEVGGLGVAVVPGDFML